MVGEPPMKSRLCTAIAIAAGLSISGASAQPTNPIDAFLARAKKAAEFDFTGTLVGICVAPQTAPQPDVTPGPAPDGATWFRHPAKELDTFYFIGTKLDSSWALDVWG